MGVYKKTDKRKAVYNHADKAKPFIYLFILMKEGYQIKVLTYSITLWSIYMIILKNNVYDISKKIRPLNS